MVTKIGGGKLQKYALRSLRTRRTGEGGEKRIEISLKRPDPCRHKLTLGSLVWRERFPHSSPGGVERSPRCVSSGSCSVFQGFPQCLKVFATSWISVGSFATKFRAGHQGDTSNFSCFQGCIRHSLE